MFLVQSFPEKRPHNAAKIIAERPKGVDVTTSRDMIPEKQRLHVKAT